MPSNGIILCLFFCPIFFSSISLFTAVLHLFELGKSKSKVKKEKKTIPIIKRLFLIGYSEKCKYRHGTAKKLCYIYWLYLSITFATIIFWILSMFISAFEELLSIFVYLKLFILDIPVNLYAFVMTRHDKIHGGVTWVWKGDK